MGGSKVTADGEGRHEIKRCLILGRKARTNLDNILKSRDITLLTKVCITQMAESEEELKTFLMRVQVESKKAGLKLNIKKTKIITSGPITSWQIDG